MVRTRGFTIIELLVVIVIIGLLTAAAATSYVNAQRNSRDSARKTTVNSLSTAVETFYADKKKFPGNIDTATGTGTLAAGSIAAYNATYGNCARVDGSNNYVYAYIPLQATSSCDSFTANASYPNYVPADFKPYPTWIPGLGAYLNPMPIERKFSDNNGVDYNAALAGTAAVMTCDETQSSCAAGTANYTRTYVYRHLSGGYAIYTRLEASSVDKDAIVAGTSIVGTPTFPTSINTVTAGNIYMVRR